MPHPRERESDVLRTILAYLRLHKIFHWRNSVGATSGTYKGKKRFIRFGTPGAPDIFIVHKQRIIGVEVKGPGGSLSADQQSFATNFRDAGGIYVVAVGIEAVNQVLRYVESIS